MEYTSRGGDRGRDELRDDGPGVAGHTFKYHVKQDALVWLKVQDDHESQVPGGLTLHASHSKDLPVRVVHHRSKNLGFFLWWNINQSSNHRMERRLRAYQRRKKRHYKWKSNKRTQEVVICRCKRDGGDSHPSHPGV